MSTQIARIKNFSIIHCGGDNYIIHNTHKDFYPDGHTHIRDGKELKTCRTIIGNLLNSKEPHTSSIYILLSYIRLAEDEDYVVGIKRLINKKKQKQKYKNRI